MLAGSRGSGARDLQDWKRRLTQAATLLLLERYEEASYRYFALAHDPVVAEAPERREAVFYLAEALRRSRHAEAARGYYRALADGGEMASYANESVIALIGIASDVGDDAGVEEAFATYRARMAPGAPIEPGVAYALAKSRFRRGRDAEADAMFAAFGDDGVRGRQARWFRAAILLRARDYAGAERAFAELAELPAANPERIAVRDHAVLAVARLRYERKAWREAADAYDRIPDASPLRAEALYEKGHAELRAGRAAIALGDAELVLIAFPDDARAPKARILRARALLALQRDDEAREAYREVLAEYGPVAGDLKKIATARDAAALLARLQAADGEGGVERALPQAAARAALQSREMRAAVGMARDLRAEDAAVEDGKTIARLIGEGIARAENGGLPSTNERRRRASLIARRIARTRLAVLEGAEPKDPAALARAREALRAADGERDAAAAAADGRRAKIEALRKTAAETTALVEETRARAVALAKYARDAAGGVQDAKLAQAAAGIGSELAGLEARRDDLDRLLRDLEARDRATRERGIGAAERAAEAALDLALDALEKTCVPGAAADDDLARLRDAKAALAAAVKDLDGGEGSRVAAAKTVLAAETAALGRADAELGTLAPRATDGAADGVRRALGRVQTSFEVLLLRADLGALDVSWAGKERESAKIRSLVEEQEAALRALDARFAPLFREGDDDGGAARAAGAADAGGAK